MKIRLVARRELREMLRERSFLISTVVMLVIVLAIAVLPSMIGGGTDEATVGVVGSNARATADRAAALAPADALRLTIRTYDDREQLNRAVADNDASVGVVGDELVVQDDPGGEVIDLLQAASGRVRAEKALTAAGVGAPDLTRVLDQPRLPVRALDPDADERSDREALALTAAIILFTSVIGFALTVAFGIVEEKNSRVVEVLLAAVKPRELLAGKVIGLALLGLAQLLAIAIPGVIAARLAGTIELPDATSPALLLTVVVWFLVGYAVYAGVFAAAGSLVSRQEDLQSTITPILLVMYGAFVGSLTASSDPDSLWAHVLTFVPLTAPMVAPARYARDALPLAEHLAALAVTALGAVALVLLASHIYERAILRIGQKVRWRDAVRRA